MICVDQLFARRPPWRRGLRGHSCHLYSTERAEELVRFALDMELPTRWLQHSRTMPHYDLSAGLRAKALRLGARSVGRHEFVAHLRAWRARSAHATAR